MALILNEISRGGGRLVALNPLAEIERGCMLKAEQHPDGPQAGVWSLCSIVMQPNSRVMSAGCAGVQGQAGAVGGTTLHGRHRGRGCTHSAELHHDGPRHKCQARPPGIPMSHFPNGHKKKWRCRAMPYSCAVTGHEVLLFVGIGSCDARPLRDQIIVMRGQVLLALP